MAGVHTPMCTALLIDGELVAGQGFVEPILNPATGEILTHIAEASTEQVETAILAAHRAFAGWSRTTPQQRSSHSAEHRRCHRKTRRPPRSPRIAELRQAAAPGAAGRSDRHRRRVSLLCRRGRVQHGALAGEFLPGYTSMVRRDPVGVIASIAPWNYPLMMAAWKFAPALAAGNTVVLKPSEQTPLTALKLAQLLAEIFPRGVINIICGRGESVGAPLVSHPRVRMVSLTGDVSTGQKILARPPPAISNAPIWNSAARRR